jgi:protocatechuate 3,4-dioxygenase beta subunit
LVSISSGQTIRVDIDELSGIYEEDKSNGKIYGVVFDNETNQPAQGLEVFVWHITDARREKNWFLGEYYYWSIQNHRRIGRIIIGSDGSYEFDGLKSGNYFVGAQIPDVGGIVPRNNFICIRPGQTFRYDFHINVDAPDYY